MTNFNVIAYIQTGIKRPRSLRCRIHDRNSGTGVEFATSVEIFWGAPESLPKVFSIEIVALSPRVSSEDEHEEPIFAD